MKKNEEKDNTNKIYNLMYISSINVNILQLFPIALNYDILNQRRAKDGSTNFPGPLDT